MSSIINYRVCILDNPDAIINNFLEYILSRFITLKCVEHNTFIVCNSIIADYITNDEIFIAFNQNKKISNHHNT